MKSHANSVQELLRFHNKHGTVSAPVHVEGNALGLVFTAGQIDGDLYVKELDITPLSWMIISWKDLGWSWPYLLPLAWGQISTVYFWRLINLA